MDYESIFYCIINDFDCLTKALSKIDETYFFDYKAQRLFREIAHCAIENERTDFSILFSWIRKTEAIQVITSEYLFSIAECGSKLDIINFDIYINQLVKQKKAELLRKSLERRHKSLVEDENAVDVELNMLKSEVEEIESKCNVIPLKPSDTSKILQQVKADKESGKVVYQWNYKKLDGYVGIKPGCLYAIAGRPGTGKTTFAMNVLTRTSNNCAMFSYEMPETPLLERFCQITGKHNKNFYTLDYSAIEKQVRNFEDLGIDLYDFGNKSELAIRDTLEQNDYDYVVIDHLQTISCSRKFKDERLKYNYLMKYLDDTRKITGTGIILLSQVSRDQDQRRPYLRDLKESAAIEELCDFVMFLYRRNDHMDDQDKLRFVEAIIAKNRYGGLTEKDDLMMTFNTATMNFHDRDQG